MNYKKALLYLCGGILILVAIEEAVLYFFYNKDPYYFAIDRCLDNGGCWDGIDKVCRKEEPNAQELCNRAKVDGKTLDQRIEEKISK